MHQECLYCENTGEVSRGGKKVKCRYCSDPEKFLKDFDRAIKIAEGKDGDTGKKLRSVREFLPDSAVMAVAEAQALGLRKELIQSIARVYDVRPFMDVSYKKKSWGVDKL